MVKISFFNYFFSSFGSDLTSVSRQINNGIKLKNRLKSHLFEAEDTWEEERSQISLSRSASVASTSLRLRWEGEPEWEDEFQGIFLLTFIELLKGI